MNFLKKSVLIFLLIFTGISVFAFISGRDSAYEEYDYVRNIRSGETPSFYYPLSLKEADTAGMNSFERYILQKGVFDKSFITNEKWLIQAAVESGYDKGLKISGSFNTGISFHVSENIDGEVSVVIDSDTSKSGFYRAKPFKDLVAAAFDKGYLEYKRDGMIFVFGRTGFHSSFDISSSMIYSYDAPPMDGIIFSFDMGKKFSYVFRYAYMEHMILDSTYYIAGDDVSSINRFIAFHKLVYNPVKGLKFSFGESVLFGRSFGSNPLDYAFPFFIYYAEQENKNVNDNLMWEFSADWNIKGRINLSYSLFVDDYQYEKEDIYDMEPPQLGHGARADIPYEKGVVTISAYLINAWVYNQYFEWNKYQLRGCNLGYSGASDILSLKLAFSYTPHKNIMITNELEYRQKGSNFVDDPWIFPTDDSYFQNTYIGIEPVFKDGSVDFKFESLYGKLKFYASLKALYGFDDKSKEASFSAGLKVSL